MCIIPCFRLLFTKFEVNENKNFYYIPYFSVGMRFFYYLFIYLNAAEICTGISYL